MNTAKPTHLVELLRSLLAEADKINIGKIYIAIVEETNRIAFVETQKGDNTELIYKHLIRLSIKDYIHSGRSEASTKVINEVIDVIANADITKI